MMCAMNSLRKYSQRVAQRNLLGLAISETFLPYSLLRRKLLYSSFSSFNGTDNEQQSQPRLSMWDTPDLRRIFDGNRKWQRKKMQEDPDYFKNLSQGQQPEFLLIGCSDSRVGAQEIMGLNQGELFVHRNIANMVVSTDLNLLSVLFYSVNVLMVKDILVLGHYECGGVRAASANKDLGLIEHWLRNIRDVQRLHLEELSAITDPELRHRRLVELNVQEQCFNLFGNSIVQQMQAKTGRPRIHGMVYDIENGLLKPLDIDFRSAVKKYREIYTVADFRRHAPVIIDNISKKEGSEEQQRQARLLFEAMDFNKSGTIEKAELREMMNRFDLNPTEEQLNNMMQPLVGKEREDVELSAFESILDVLYRGRHTKGTDRLVVVTQKGVKSAPLPLRCRASTSILDVKKAINTMVGTPVEHQVLRHKGCRLKDDTALLAEAGIRDIAEVEMSIEIVPAAFKRQSNREEKRGKGVGD